MVIPTDMNRDEKQDEIYSIANPYVGTVGYHCFACAPHNGLGLGMHFRREGQSITCRWQPRRDYQGYTNVLHGGIQATLMDEIASWTIFVLLGTSGVTTGLESEYRTPVNISDELLICGSIHSVDRSQALIDTQIYQDSETPCTVGLCRYRLFSETVARRRLNYPGVAAFIGEKRD